MAIQELSIWLPLLLLLSLIFLKKMKKHEQKNFPPSPPKLPIIGNLHQIGALPHSSMYDLSKIYGPIMSLQLGRLRTLIISSAEAAKDVLKIHDLACCSRPSLAGSGRLTYNYRDMAFSPYGAYWREVRKICVLELFSLKRVRSYQTVRKEELNSLIESINDSAKSNTPVDLTEKLFSLTASIIYRIAFGRRFKTSDFKHHKTVHGVLHETEAVMGSFQASEYFHPFVGWIIDSLRGQNQRLERVFDELDTCFQQMIDDHLDPAWIKPDQEDIIDVLLGVEKEHTEVGVALIGKDNIKAILLNIFLGGIDTGAITIVWAMTELVRNPKLMSKAQQEIRIHLAKKEGKFTEDDIDQLLYLKLIVKETLRLHPPAPLLLPRQTMSSCNLQGYEIPPNTLIQVNAWAIGRDPQYWRNPEEFIPERFEDSSVDYKGQDYEFLPFGGGRRICPGMYMATTMVELVLANLLYWFDWELPHGMKPEDLNIEESVGRSLTLSKKELLILTPLIPGLSR